MKKLKNLRMVLIALGLMGSLSFVNCYAMEKNNNNNREMFEILQEEDEDEWNRDILQEKKDEIKKELMGLSKGYNRLKQKHLNLERDNQYLEQNYRNTLNNLMVERMAGIEKFNRLAEKYDSSMKKGSTKYSELESENIELRKRKEFWEKQCNRIYNEFLDQQDTIYHLKREIDVLKHRLEKRNQDVDLLLEKISELQQKLPLQEQNNDNNNE